MKHGTFFSLISVENTKLWKRLSTKIVVLILALLTIGSVGIYRVSCEYQRKNVEAAYKKQQAQTQNIDWKQVLQEDSKELEAKIKNEEESTSLTLKNNIDSDKMSLAENNYRIDHNLKKDVNPLTFKFWEVFAEFGMWSFVALLVIITTSALVAGEFSDNTMKTMISRPYTRNQILSAKLIVTVLFTVEMLLMTYVLSFLSVAAIFGTNGIDIPQLLWIGGKIVEMSGFAASMVTLGLDLISSLVFVLLSFFLATVSHSRAVATGVSIFAVFGSSIFMIIAQHFSWGKYIYLAEASFSSFVSMGAPFYDVTLSFSLIYGLAWTLALIVMSYFTFAKRDIN